MNYLQWNDAIGRHFFNSDRSGRRVFLFITEDLLNEIGSAAGADKSDFLRVVKKGPPWNTRQGHGICQHALQAYEEWRDRKLEYPPYLCYLALFVWAGSIDVGFAKHAYYPSLRSLIGEEPEIGMYPSFNLMYKLWNDLAVWSNADHHGDLGIFDADIVGEWMHVGLPRAQTLLTDHERENLPRLFADSGLDPRSRPSEKELGYLLTHDRGNYLRPRTKRLIQSVEGGESAARAALFDVFFEELEHWDCESPVDPDATEQTRTSFAALRIGMSIDLTAKKVQCWLRCRSSRPYPEQRLRLVPENTNEVLLCGEDWQGWSTPLERAPPATGIFDSTLIDWGDGYLAEDHDQGWKASLLGRSIRILVSSAEFGFDGLLEENQIPQSRGFHVLVHSNHSADVQKWGNAYCHDFLKLNVSGLPQGWQLFSIGQATSDAIIKNTFPFLEFPSVLRVSLHGGLRFQRNQYFDFGLPTIELSGLLEGVSVFCNDFALMKQSTGNFYIIPPEVHGRRFTVEVRKDGVSARKKTFYSINTLRANNEIEPIEFDRFGLKINHAQNDVVSGVILRGGDGTHLTPELRRTGRRERLFYIGRNPGEVVRYSDKSALKSWAPVWIVLVRKGEGQAFYCGSNLDLDEPCPWGYSNSKQSRLWSLLLWHMRKRISPPSAGPTNRLWNRYKHAAKHGS